MIRGDTSFLVMSLGVLAQFKPHAFHIGHPFSSSSCKHMFILLVLGANINCPGTTALCCPKLCVVLRSAQMNSWLKAATEHRA
jgi:hypothetical protein